MKYRFLMGVVVGALLASVCCFFFGGSNPKVECQTDPNFQYTFTGNAGCLVRQGNEMLLVRDVETGKLTPPGGGPKPGESAQCTAHRETWEEAGVNVRVGKLLKNFNDNFYLFDCHLSSLPFMRHEVVEVYFADPTPLTKEDWRFPGQLPEMKALFQSLAK